MGPKFGLKESKIQIEQKFIAGKRKVLDLVSVSVSVLAGKFSSLKDFHVLLCLGGGECFSFISLSSFEPNVVSCLQPPDRLSSQMQICMARHELEKVCVNFCHNDFSMRGQIFYPARFGLVKFVLTEVNKSFYNSLEACQNRLKLQETSD